MEQFAAIAIAHFLALLIPGVDFFLIARTALTSGWRTATGACVGIATANGIFIITAFSGVSLISHPTVLATVQFAGGTFLISVGIAFIRSNPHLDTAQKQQSEPTTWGKNFGLGITSGLLNPKNALFYLSLASVLAGDPPLTIVAYGTWMFAVVLLWDVFVARALGSQQALTGLKRIIPWLTKTAGVFLVLLGAGMIIGASMEVLA